MSTARERGTVAWFSNTKGFGFIKRQDKPDLFVHFSAVASEGYRTLTEGQEVEFSVVPGREDKPQAADVKVIA